jgi:hypothetical protein
MLERKGRIYNGASRLLVKMRLSSNDGHFVDPFPFF